MIPLIVIRPQPGCDATVNAAHELGLTARGFPLFVVRPIAWIAPNSANFDALLIGSANALRHGGAALKTYCDKPVYAVGKTTAEAARHAGFDVVACGEGGLQALLDLLHPEHRRLLRLAGQARVALTPTSGVSITERITYSSESQLMPVELITRLRQPAVVMLHSAEAARHFARQCDAHAIGRRRLHLAALGPRIAEAAGRSWGSVVAAAAPNDQSLLALALQLCQKVGEAEN